MKVCLDLGTGFVKCVSGAGSVRFPPHARRVGSNLSTKVSEAAGAGVFVAGHDRRRGCRPHIERQAGGLLPQGAPD